MASSVHHDIAPLLRDQLVRVPDLERLFMKWEPCVNPNKDQVKQVVEDILAKYTVSERVNAKLTRNMLDDYVANCYPFAGRDTLTELTYFVCWMFLVDDEIDRVTGHNGCHENSLLTLWDDVLDLIRSNLSEGEEADIKGCGELKPMEVFSAFGKSLQRGYTKEQCSRYMTQLLATAEGYLAEQRFRDKSELPDYEAYCKYRSGRCCMGQVVSLIEFANGSQLPAEIMDSPEMEKLLANTVILLWINNDIVSLRKELRDGFFENLVGISSGSACDLQAGLNHVVGRLEEAIQEIDSAASALMASATENIGHLPKDLRRVILDHLKLYISNCKSMCRGIVSWSMKSPRYELSELARNNDNSVNFRVVIDSA
uniref:Terpene synthase n=1 Tax=Bionectria ochroleuca TaxID=29856 RepID=A0A8H7N068_BIOOC